MTEATDVKDNLDMSAADIVDAEPRRIEGSKK